MARTRVGLDIGSTGVRAAELAAGDARRRFSALPRCPCPRGGGERGGPTAPGRGRGPSRAVAARRLQEQASR